MKSKRLRLLTLLVVAIALVAGVVWLRRFLKRDTTNHLTNVYTILGAPTNPNAPRLEDPFGIAVAPDGTIFVSDGDKGIIWEIKSDGSAKVVCEKLDTPSGIALAPDGSIVVAETGAHLIRRVFPSDGRTEVISGTPGRAGYSDGSRGESLFNGPVGVAVDSTGTIFVADTYNDRIRAIDKEGRTRTIAGGNEAGFADSSIGTDARFNTPCGIAISPNGDLIVADTGNNRIRGIAGNGSVRTIAGSGRRGGEDGFLYSATFRQPLGVVVDKDGTILVADSGGSRLRGCGWNLFPRVWTLTGEAGEGFLDGQIKSARLNRPAGIAIAPDGSVLFTDNANKVVRGISGKAQWRGATLDSSSLLSLFPAADAIRSSAPGRWPYDPSDRPREIAATFGEIRGEITDTDKEAWFHNGLDIPGAYGETVRAVRTERVMNPLSVADVETSRERIRLPLLGYVHLRIGRDASGVVLDKTKFITQLNEEGEVALVRVRRGTRFEAGEPLGTLNNQNHVHLTVGPVGNECNAIAALELPGIRDTVAPTIEVDGIRLFDSSWHELRSDGKDQPVKIAGDVRIVARAYDQMDGNATRRRLGLYRLGYQVLTSEGKSAPGFGEPSVTISFETLPSDDAASWIAYAPGSQSGATGETIFGYIVSNIVREKNASENFLPTSSLAPGFYTLRVFAEDFFGNRTTRDMQVNVRPASR